VADQVAVGRAVHLDDLSALGVDPGAVDEDLRALNDVGG
jgi:hypothetical protein